MSSRIFRLFLLLLLACCGAAWGDNKKPAPSKDQRPGPGYSKRADAMQEAEAIAQRLGLEPQWVRSTLGQARFTPRIAQLMAPAPSGTAKNWQAYRSRFIEPLRIRAGLAFWQKHQAELEQAQARYGVPVAIIVGILGVETIYGQQMGNFRVIDALATLAFDFPTSHPRAQQRSAYFKSELGYFLGLSRRSNFDPLALHGSYAGAMGMPQFMPSSWEQHAIDGDGDGRIDLFRSTADVIGSVANYLQAYGWKPGMVTHYPLEFDAAQLDLEALLLPDILPTFSLASLRSKGVVLVGAALQHSGPLALIELQNGAAAASYVVGSENFYALTRYNWSSYYAMAVIELGQAVAAELQK